MRKVLASLLVLALGCVALGAPAIAKKKKVTPVTIDCAASPGLTISQPGRYRLAQAVENCAADPMIRVDASKVVLDLGDNLLEADGTGSGVIVSPGTRKVTVRGGHIRRVDTGVGVFGTRATVSGVSVGGLVTEGIVLFGANDIVQGCTITNLSGIGIRVHGTDASITRNHISRADTGVLLLTGSHTVSRNLITGSTGSGVSTSVMSTGNLFSKNTVTAGGGIGLNLSGGSVIKQNTVVGNNSAGIIVPVGSTATRNIVRGNANGLIANGANTLLKGNRAIANSFDGIQADNDATISLIKNVANGNAGNGIAAGPLVTGRKNRASGNIGTQCDPASLCA